MLEFSRCGFVFCGALQQPCNGISFGFCLLHSTTITLMGIFSQSIGPLGAGRKWYNSFTNAHWRRLGQTHVLHPFLFLANGVCYNPTLLLMASLVTQLGILVVFGLTTQPTFIGGSLGRPRALQWFPCSPFDVITSSRFSQSRAMAFPPSQLVD